MQYIGYPYSATGNSPSTGFSCIGFVSFVYRQNGINLPGDLGDAMAYAPQVSFSNLAPGDIVYFQNTIWNGLSHAAIYIGGGKFIHAEWYGYGVRISSFNNDPRDGSYWIGKYLGANRPWNGAAVPAPYAVSTPGGAASAAGPGPTTQVVRTVGGSQTAVVNAPSLYVRSGPSKSSAPKGSVSQGTTLVILGKSHGWYKVQLPDGTTGWVMAKWVNTSGGPSVSTGSGAANGLGNPTAPARQGYPSASHAPAGIMVHVGTLYVHSAPSRDSYVVTTVSYGQHLQILARQNGWIEVVLPNGSVGWVRGAANPSSPHPSQSSTVAAPSSSSSASISFSGGSRTSVPTNVRTGPSMSNGVATVIPAGGAYQIIGWSHGWAHVRLADGTTGWVRGDVIGGAKASTGSKTSAQNTGQVYGQYTYSHPPSRSKSASHRQSSKSSGAARSVVTVGVRVHSRPGVKAPVIGGAAAGTHVQVLGYSGGWALVRLPSGQTGYVLGTYVH